MSGAVFNTWLMRMQKVLDIGDEPIAAIALAARCRVGGNRETQRRRIRALVERMREHGYRICASADGYFVARDDAEWHAYQEARSKHLRFDFVRLSKMKTAAGEQQNGQGKLFDQPGQNHRLQTGATRERQDHRFQTGATREV